jgi:hypothetical protein
MPTIAGEPATLEQVRGTVRMLRYYRAFLASSCDECWDLQSNHDFAAVKYFGYKPDREQARTRLGWLVNVAINRKAGIPDSGRRKRDPDYQIRLRRDCVYIRNWLNHRMRFYSLETPEMRQRYGHLIARYDE